MLDLNAYGLDLGPWSQALVLAALTVLAAAVLFRVGSAVVLGITRPSPVLHEAALSARSPSRYLVPLVALQLLWHSLRDGLPHSDGVEHFNGVLLIAAVTWLALRIIRGVTAGVLRSHPLDSADNLGARRIQTQARMLARVVMLVIVIVGAALILMTFPGVRQVGASLLASAGVAGLIAGIAARPVISNLIAGLQIALAQPLRIDDVLVVNNEWGRVEEITGTYVVLRIWDERRLIIPLQWLIENPFQNWTRSSAQIMGSVFIWVDYRTPLAPLREEALRVCQSASEWDGRVCVLQVVEAGERAIQLRILVTSARSDLNWDLRCKVREALVDLMQRDYAEYLPLTRADVRSEEPGQRPSGASVDAAAPGDPHSVPRMPTAQATAPGIAPV